VKLEAGADAGSQVGVGEAGGQRVDGAPAGAVRGDEVVGVKLGERVAGGGDDRLEQRAVEVKAADDGVHASVGRGPSVAHRVDAAAAAYP
jgi:hypothetical protein